jgi:predicted O-methyltransferase YrrM
MQPHVKRWSTVVAVLGLGAGYLLGFTAPGQESESIDRKVRAFLETHKYQWRYENIAAEDGKVLFDLILANRYVRALEIGTSTGHSAIWMAWALSKTGGRLITVEIDEYRYQKALENFKRAGLSDYVDARLADAHELVEQLEGPFDFVFIDADKNWYTNYVKEILPKLESGGCITARNVRNLLYMRGIREFLDYVRSRPELETTIDETSSSGISISYKRRSIPKKSR